MNISKFGYITHEGVEYKFTWNKVGFSYAEIHVRVKSKFLGLIPYWKSVYSTGRGFNSGHALLCNVEKAKPNKLTEWCVEALAEYLDYKQAWDEVR